MAKEDRSFSSKENVIICFPYTTKLFNKWEPLLALGGYLVIPFYTEGQVFTGSLQWQNTIGRMKIWQATLPL